MIYFCIVQPSSLNQGLKISVLKYDCSYKISNGRPGIFGNKNILLSLCFSLANIEVLSVD